MPYVISDGCVDIMDKSCIEECPVDCIYEGGRMLYIHPAECVDCGACEPVCPENAIYFVSDLPADRKVYEQVNADFFANLESASGGGRKLGKIDYDPPLIEAMPGQQD